MDTELTPNQVSDKYRELRYGKPTRADWKSLAAAAHKAAQNIQRKIEDVYASGKAGFRLEASLLETYDMQKDKMLAVMMNAERAAQRSLA